MKKFIKNWWPVLLIAGWWLWKRSKRSSQSQSSSTQPIDINQFQGHQVLFTISDDLTSVAPNGKKGFRRQGVSEYEAPIGGSVMDWLSITNGNAPWIVKVKSNDQTESGDGWSNTWTAHILYLRDGGYIAFTDRELQSGEVRLKILV